MTQDHDENKNIPDQLYKIALESEGSAAKVFDQIDICINSFDEIKELLAELMGGFAQADRLELTRDLWFEKLESMISQCENGMGNLNGVLDIFQYQDIVRQKLEKVGHQLIEISQFIQKKLQPETQALAHLPPSGKDILDRKALKADDQAGNVEDVIAEFLKNKNL
jgi:hypothetical protein